MVRAASESAPGEAIRVQSIESYLAQDGLARFPFLFVVTYGRSGSTLLTGLLNALPGYCIRGENYATLVPLFRAVKRLDRAHAEFGGRPTTPTDPWYGAELTAPDLLAAGCADAFLRAVLAPPRGTRCVGFKEIRYSTQELPGDELAGFLDYLASAFPGAAVVFNVRDHDSTARSGWWGRQRPDEVKQRLRQTEAGMRAYARVHPHRTFVFSYDMLMQEPDYFAELCGFLGELYDGERTRAVLAISHSSVTPPSPPRQG